MGVGLRLRLTHAQLGLKRDLQVLMIGSAAFVQDDQINRELLHPPVFVSAQQLTRDVDICDIIDSQQHDRQVP